MDENNIIELSKKANELFLSGEYSQSLVYYLQALSYDIENSIANCNVGIAYHMMDEIELAVAFYKKAIRIDNQNIRAINNLSRIYVENIKDYATAVKYLDFVIKNSPKDPEAYNIYGNIFLENKEYEKAETYFKKSIFLDEKYFKNYYDIALVYAGLNDKDKAKAALNKCLQLNISFGPALELKEKLS